MIMIELSAAWKILYKFGSHLLNGSLFLVLVEIKANSDERICQIIFRLAP